MRDADASSARGALRAVSAVCSRCRMCERPREGVVRVCAGPRAGAVDALLAWTLGSRRRILDDTGWLSRALRRTRPLAAGCERPGLCDRIGDDDMCDILSWVVCGGGSGTMMIVNFWRTPRALEPVCQRTASAPVRLARRAANPGLFASWVRVCARPQAAIVSSGILLCGAHDDKRRGSKGHCRGIVAGNWNGIIGARGGRKERRRRRSR
ncbi:hypothetical protein C8Q78DRAFT_613585 [Trametes maxima]|nr:hypothetical protein C8Q78DRAFT_613585 [Trametes maxima]